MLGGRARYGGRPDVAPGKRNGFGSRVQAAEGEPVSSEEIPQVHEAAETFASKLFARGTWIQGLSVYVAELTTRTIRTSCLDPSPAAAISAKTLRRRQRSGVHHRDQAHELPAGVADAVGIAVPVLTVGDARGNQE